MRKIDCLEVIGISKGEKDLKTFGYKQLEMTFKALNLLIRLLWIELSENGRFI